MVGMVMVQELARLENGARLSREEFHRLYEQCEGLEHVELIEGVVYMPSPIKFLGHSREQALAIEWMAGFARFRADIEWGPPSSLLLDERNEPEPDVMMFYGRPDRFADGYFKGAPELVMEIANTSVSRDLHAKKDAYERNGVLEYIVWRTAEACIDWFQLRDGRYVRREPDARGIIESEVFLGLRLDVPAMLRQDLEAVLRALAKHPGPNT